MKRYRLDAIDTCSGVVALNAHIEEAKDVQGEWVRWEDVEDIIKRLKQCQAERRFSDGLDNLQNMGCY